MLVKRRVYFVIFVFVLRPLLFPWRGGKTRTLSFECTLVGIIIKCLEDFTLEGSINVDITTKIFIQFYIVKPVLH